MRAPDFRRRLLRALDRAGTAAGVAIDWQSAEAFAWANGLFVGERHLLIGTGAASAALDRFLAALPETDLPIAGGCVADAVVTGVTSEGETRTITAMALVLAE